MISAFKCFAFGPGFREFTGKSRELSSEPPIWSEIKNRVRIHRGQTGGWLLCLFSLLLCSLLCSGSQLWLKQPAWSGHACQLGIAQHHLNLCICQSTCKFFLWKNFPFGDRFLQPFFSLLFSFIFGCKSIILPTTCSLWWKTWEWLTVERKAKRSRIWLFYASHGKYSRGDGICRAT